MDVKDVLYDVYIVYEYQPMLSTHWMRAHAHILQVIDAIVKWDRAHTVNGNDYGGGWW